MLLTVVVYKAVYAGWFRKIEGTRNNHLSARYLLPLIRVHNVAVRLMSD